MKSTMNKIWTVIVLLTFASFTLCFGNDDNHETHVNSHLEELEWTTKVILENGVELKWITRNSEYLTFDMKCPTTGWIAVGFSHNGAMNGADIVMGWVDKHGKAHIRDLHGVGNVVPEEDDSQDVELLGGESENGWTRIRFRRKWNTCDKHDFIIGEETVKLMWAYGRSNPSSSRFNPAYHGRYDRGQKMVNLRLPGQHTRFPDENDPNIKYFDVTMNKHPVPALDVTEYFCQMMKYPSFDSKTQIVGWKPLIQKENIPVVHHIVIYECIVPEGNSTEIFEHHLGRVEYCYSPNMPPEWLGYCWTQPLIWTIGGEGEMFPLHTGMPLGERFGGSTYFFMEIHYDIPDLKPFVDSSGLRIYYTEKPRQEDLSTLFIGKRFSAFHFIAPQAMGYQAFGGCTSECTQKAIPSKGITATHALLHAHQVTKKIVLRHIRNGKELPPLAMDTNYDINYQQSRVITPPRLILPGDELYTYCDYDTTERTIPVWGGITTNDTEMCHTFLTYYPKLPLATCQWQIEYEDFIRAFDIQKLEGDILPVVSTPYKPMKTDKFDPEDEVLILLAKNKSTNLFTQLTIREPIIHAGKNFWEYLVGLKWGANGAKLAHTLNRRLEKSRNYAYCTEHAHYKIHLEKYIMDPPVFENYVDPAQDYCSRQINTGIEVLPNAMLLLLTSAIAIVYFKV